MFIDWLGFGGICRLTYMRVRVYMCIRVCVSVYVTKEKQKVSAELNNLILPRAAAVTVETNMYNRKSDDEGVEKSDRNAHITTHKQILK